MTSTPAPAAPSAARQSTGVPGLDELLGGGLVPGTLTVLVGATGVGKTQFGLQFAQAGAAQEDRAGVFFDMSVRGDSQSHADYAARIFGRSLSVVDAGATPNLDDFFARRAHGDYLRLFDHRSRRITRDESDFYAWHEWQAQVNARTTAAIAFLYGNLIHGVRRVVVDGIEPVDRPRESLQFEMFEYLYHQVLRKEPEWVARDLFRQHYLRHAEEAARHAYDPSAVGCMLLVTSRETMLEDLISRGLDEGDVLSGANSVILLGKIRDGARIGRALYVAKHRGSACTDEIVPFAIGDAGLSVVDGSKS
ncbi:MAG: recombinase RecA [Planctomycetota bacterium]|nr:MAG: recombinase RecA [Planctomycetota bacterium]